MKTVWKQRLAGFRNWLSRWRSQSAHESHKNPDTDLSPLGAAAAALRKRAAERRLVDPNSQAADADEALAARFEEGQLQNAIVADIEWHKAKLQDWIHERQHILNWTLENDRQLIGLGQAGIRGATLINAGAAVAILAFVSNVLSKGVAISPFTAALAWFAGGVGISTIAIGTTYITQLLYGSDTRWIQKAGITTHVASVLLWILSLAAFAQGCVVVHRSFETVRIDSPSQEAAPMNGEKKDAKKKSAPPPRRPPASPPAPKVPLPSRPNPDTPRTR